MKRTNIVKIQRLAKQVGVKLPLTARKPELIRAIQAAEGNFSCFGTATSGDCDQQSCRWRADCLQTAG